MIFHKKIHSKLTICRSVRPKSDFMVVVPEFTLSQDSDFVYVSINCPNVRASDMELVIIGTEFHFSSDPYLLFLNFEHRILDSERGTASYDVDSGVFSAKLEKAVPGEDFPELVLLSTLKPRRTPSARPLISVVVGSASISYDDSAPDPANYGFNFWAHRYFSNVEDTIPYVCDLPRPDDTPHPLRRAARTAAELDDFDPDQVMIDYVRPPPYDASAADAYLSALTPAESKALLAVPTLDFLMSRATARLCFLSCVDVVFATVYDTVLFGADGTCESHWTIAKLSSTLSWFDAFDDAADLVLACVRRVLAYPLYRSYSFARLCWERTAALLLGGRAPLLKCLLHARAMMERGEFRWRLNRLYIDPMIAWLQELDEGDFVAFSDEVRGAVDAFPAAAAVEDEWCVDLLERLAEKRRAEIEADPPEEEEAAVLQRCAVDSKSGKTAPQLHECTRAEQH